MRWLLLSLALMIATAQSQEAPAKKTNQRHTQKSAKDERGTDKYPLAVKIQTTEEEKDEAARREKEKTENDKQLVKWTRWLVVMAGLQFFAFIGQGIIFAMQAKRLRETIAEMKIATQATKDAAIAAKTSADAYQVAERAWVGCSDVIPSQFSDGTVDGVAGQSGILLRMKWTNGGRTPAIGCNITVDHRVVDLPLDVPRFSVGSSGREQHRAPMLPGVDASSGAIPVISAHIESLRNRQKRIFIYGRVDYTDVFNPRAHRETEVCYEVEWGGIKVEPDGQRSPYFEFTAIGPQNRAT